MPRGTERPIGPRAAAVVGALALAAVGGCDVDLGAVLGEEPSLFDVEGRRVGLLLDTDAEVCAGSAERLSREVERAERAFGWGPHADRVEIHLFESDLSLIERCGHPGGCYRGFPRDRAIFERRDDMGLDAVYWIPFDRIDVEYFGDLPEFLRHGIAAAVGDLGCSLASVDRDDLMSRAASDGLTQDEGRVVGQLIRALVRDHPPERLNAWLEVLDRESAPDYVRATFAQVFPGTLDDTWDAALAEPSVLPPPGGWCQAAELPPTTFEPESWELDVRFDCSDPRIEGDLGPIGLYTAEVSVFSSTAGRLPIAGEVPGGTRVEWRPCGCGPKVWAPAPPSGPWTEAGWSELRIVAAAADGRRARLSLGPVEP